MTASVLRALHHDRAPGDPLVLPGPRDAASARVFAELGAAGPQGVGQHPCRVEAERRGSEASLLDIELVDDR